MSEGPIQREREAWKPPVVSTPDRGRLCARRPGTAHGAYCGRRGTLVETWAEVTCADCLAAQRADDEAKEGKTP